MFQSWNPNLTRSASACQRTSDSPNSASWKRVEQISASLSEQCWAQTNLKTCLRNPRLQAALQKSSEYNHIQRHLRSIHMTIINVFSRFEHHIIFTDILPISHPLSYGFLTVWVLRGHFPVLAPILCTNIRCQGQNSLCRFKFKIVRM